jgi:hypothetical protein
MFVGSAAVMRDPSNVSHVGKDPSRRNEADGDGGWFRKGRCGALGPVALLTYGISDLLCFCDLEPLETQLCCGHLFGLNRLRAAG